MMASFTNSYFQSPLGQVNRQSPGNVGALGSIGSLQQGALSGLGGVAKAAEQHPHGGMVQSFLNKYQNDQAYRTRMDGLFGQPFANYVTPRFTEQYGVSAENLTFKPSQPSAQQMVTPKLINDPGQKDTPQPSAPKPPTPPPSAAATIGGQVQGIAQTIVQQQPSLTPMQQNRFARGEPLTGQLGNR